MSAVVAIRNATQMLTVSERGHISGIIDILKTKFKELNTEAVKHEKTTKIVREKRNTLLSKIREIEPHFNDEEQSYDDLKNVLDTVKSNKTQMVKENKRRQGLEKKWNDAGFGGAFPEMDNDALDNHIKTLIKAQRDKKISDKKMEAQLLSAENKRKKVLVKLTELGLQPAASSSLEELQQILTEYNETEKQSKKDVLTIKKFRNQLNELISNNPDAGIKNSAEDVGAVALENAVKAARITRDLFKKNKLENDKAVKAKQRADNKIADDKNKSEMKEKKLADKESGIKGAKKNGFYQAFTSWITEEISSGNIDQSIVDDAGGKGKFNSNKWAEMNDTQKKDPTAPWNLISA